MLVHPETVAASFLTGAEVVAHPTMSSAETRYGARRGLRIAAELRMTLSTDAFIAF